MLTDKAYFPIWPQTGALGTAADKKSGARQALHRRFTS
jgi:hypothetical protein